MSHEYDDPARQLERREFRTIGCGACEARQLRADRRGYECIHHQRGFPDETRYTCNKWTPDRHGGR